MSFLPNQAVTQIFRIVLNAKPGKPVQGWEEIWQNTLENKNPYRVITQVHQNRDIIQISFSGTGSGKFRTKIS